MRTMGEAYGWLSVRKNGTVFGLRARDNGANAARRASDGLHRAAEDGRLARSPTRSWIARCRRMFPEAQAGCLLLSASLL